MMQSALGISTHMGWAAVAAVLVDAGVPRATRTFRLETGDPTERESLEPYHLAAGYRGATRVPPPPDPLALLEAGLRRQRRHTAAKLDGLLHILADWPRPAAAALFVGRGRQTADLARVLASHPQIHVAEGNAVREAVRQALSNQAIPVLEIDRRELPGRASATLALDPDLATATLRALRPDNGGTWRQEERQCALGAWLALADTGR